MKKLLALILASLMVLSLVACGGGSSSTGTSSSSAPAASTTPAPSSSDAAPAASGGEFNVSDSDPNVTIMIAHSSGEETVLNRACLKYKELAGLRIRLMDSPVPMAYWKQWGANPGPLAWSEVYMALQQNMFEAQENPYDSIIAANLQEVQKYLIQTNHVMFYTALMMNKAFYDSQPDNYKAILDKVAEEACAYAYQDAKDSSAANLQKLQDAGMTYIALTDDDYAKMRANASDADNIVKSALGF